MFSLLFFLLFGSGKKNSRKKREVGTRQEKVPRTVWAASRELSSGELGRRESGRSLEGTKRFIPPPELPCVFLHLSW